MAARNFFVPGSHAFNGNGLAIPGATATLYTTGTTTPAAFYSDSGLSVSLGSTITANGIGRFPTAYGSDAIAYRLILKDAAGAELDGGDIDPFYFGQQIIDLIAPGISPEAYGAEADGTTDDHAAFVSALAAISAAGGGKLLLTPGKTYLTASTLTFDIDDLVIEGHGATLRNAYTGQCINFAGDRMKVLGLAIDLPTLSATYIDVSGADVTLEGDGAKITRANTANIPMYLRSTASGFRMRGYQCEWYGGINSISCSRFKIIGNKFINPTATAADDGIAIKATTSSATDIEITNNYFEGMADFVGIGSEIGTPAANDSTYSKYVRGVTITGNTGKNCGCMLLIKPGGVDSIDYRDGTVRGVTFSNNTLIDESGTNLTNAIILRPGRGARIFNVTGKDNKVIGRVKIGSSNPYGVFSYIRNDGVGTADPVIKGIDVQVDVIDPYDGVASGGSVAGSPWDYAWRLEKAAVGVGTVSDFVIDSTVNGTQYGGISVSTGLDNAILVRRAHMTNIGTSGSSSFGCIDIFSAITVGNDIAMSVAGGSGCVQYKINAGGSVAQQFPQQLAALSVVGNATNALATGTAIAAGSDGQVMRRSGTTVGFGTVATAGIADDAVTYDKLQNVSATSRFLGRITAAAGNAEELTGTQAATLIDAATTSLQGVMSAQDKTRMDALFTVYRSLLVCSGSITAAQAAATYGMGQGDPLAVSGTGTLYPLNSIHIAAADYPAVGTLNPKLRIRVNIECNDVAPGVTFTVGLHPITRPGTSGGAGVCIYTIGTAVASSTIAVATPAADSSSAAVTAADFSLPADGRYVIGVVTSGGALAASSHVHLSAVLQIRYA